MPPTSLSYHYALIEFFQKRFMKNLCDCYSRHLFLRESTCNFSISFSSSKPISFKDLDPETQANVHQNLSAAGLSSTGANTTYINQYIAGSYTVNNYYCQHGNKNEGQIGPQQFFRAHSIHFQSIYYNNNNWAYCGYAEYGGTGKSSYGAEIQQLQSNTGEFELYLQLSRLLAQNWHCAQLSFYFQMDLLETHAPEMEAALSQLENDQPNVNQPNAVEKVPDSPKKRRRQNELQALKPDKFDVMCAANNELRPTRSHIKRQKN